MRKWEKALGICDKSIWEKGVQYTEKLILKWLYYNGRSPKYRSIEVRLENDSTESGTDNNKT